jgi:hypothetical protein
VSTGGIGVEVASAVGGTAGVEVGTIGMGVAFAGASGVGTRVDTVGVDCTGPEQPPISPLRYTRPATEAAPQHSSSTAMMPAGNSRLEMAERCSRLPITAWAAI